MVLLSALLFGAYLMSLLPPSVGICAIHYKLFSLITYPRHITNYAPWLAAVKLKRFHDLSKIQIWFALFIWLSGTLYNLCMFLNYSSVSVFPFLSFWAKNVAFQIILNPHAPTHQGNRTASVDSLSVLLLPFIFFVSFYLFFSPQPVQCIEIVPRWNHTITLTLLHALDQHGHVRSSGSSMWLFQVTITPSYPLWSHLK